MADSGETGTDKQEEPEPAPASDEPERAADAPRVRDRSPSPERDSARARSRSHSRSRSRSRSPAQVPQAPQAQQAPELISAEEIRRLLEEREELRRNRDYAGSDRLRDDLRAKGVSVNDREKSWVADDGRSGMFGTSVDMGGGGVSGESITTDEIMQILTDREAARASRDYAKGDQLRDQLRAKGIQVHDRERTWRAPDGRSGTFGGGGGGGFGGGGGGGGGYGGAMMGQAGPMNDYEIVKVLEQREEARKNRDYASSDRIRDELRARGVQVHDTERRWSTQDGRRYVLVAGETLITSAAKCAP